MGGGAVPASLTSLALRYLAAPAYLFQETTGASATTPAAADGDPVGTWRDLGGNARYLTAATDATRPTLRLVSGVWEVQFDGVDDALLNAAYTLPLGSPWSMAVAYRVAASAHGSFVHHGSAAAGYGIGCGAVDQSGNGTNLIGYNAAVGWDVDGVHNGTGAVLVRRASATTRTWDHNGTTSTTGAAGINAGGTGFYVGRIPPASGVFLAGGIRELLVGEAAWSDAEKVALSAYFAAAYGVTL
jgi:hypothetical protein